MRITLVQPDQPGSFLGKNFAVRLPSLGVMQVAGCTPDGHEVEIRDESLETLDFDAATDLVGISVMTPNAPRAYEIAAEYRKRGVPVVLGGVHTGMQPDEAAEHADSIVIGEAEEAWPDLVRDFANGKLQPRYKGRKNRPLGADHPRPRRDLAAGKGYSPVHFVETTRGCSHACEFCSVTSYWGGKFRSRPIDDVVEELKNLPDLSGRRISLKNFVFFVDDNVASNREYAAELFKAIRPLGLMWVGQAALEMCEDPELLKLAAASGCRGLLVGFESVTDANREFCRKLATKERYRRAIENVHAAGIGLEGSFIVGFDHDDERTFDAIHSFAIETKLDSVYLSVLTPYPGTILHRRMKKQGRLLGRDWSQYNTSQTVFEPANFTPGALESRYEALYQRVLSNWSIARRCIGMGRNRLQFFLPMNLLFQRTIRRGVRIREAARLRRRPSTLVNGANGNGVPAPRSGKDELLAVIPAYNEAASVAEVVEQSIPHVGEVLVVNDGSLDDTAAVAGRAGATVITHPVNLGKATALQTGFDYAVSRGYRAAVLIDADGQHDPDEIPAFERAWREGGAHVVAGDRMPAAGEKMPLSRRIVNQLTARVASWIVGQDLPDCHCGYRLVDAEVMRSFRLETKRFTGDSEILVRSSLNSFRIAFVPIRCIYRQGGKSAIRPIPDAVRLLAYAVKAATERFQLSWRG